jgi:uncharacterized protein (TIGR02270 family)
MPYSPPPPRWDIVEEHLHEAEFLWGLWEHGLRAPDFTPDDVARGPEARLTANLTGLTLNGPEVAPRLLIPALTADDPQLVTAAAAALLADPSPTGLDAVLTALHDLPAQRPALTRALACAAHPQLLPRLRPLLDIPDLRITAAEILLVHDVPLTDLTPTLREDPAARPLLVRAAADDPAARDDDAPLTDLLHAALTDPDLALVDLAITTGARLGLAPAWARARARASDPDAATALLLLALADRDLPLVLAALTRRRRRRAALWALGFLATPEAVDAALEHLDDPADGPLAGEVFTAVTGLDLVRAGMALPRRDDDALAHAPEHSLPRPDPMPLLRWWTQHRGEFIDGQRYLAGAPRTRAGLHAALARGPMRRRPAHLLDLQLHTRPLQRLDPLAPIARQRRQMAALGPTAGLPLTLA